MLNRVTAFAAHARTSFIMFSSFHRIVTEAINEHSHGNTDVCGPAVAIKPVHVQSRQYLSREASQRPQKIQDIQNKCFPEKLLSSLRDIGIVSHNTKPTVSMKPKAQHKLTIM